MEPWNKNIKYGNLIQSGIEGFIKTRQTRGASKFIQNEFERQVAEYHDYDEIAWWSSLANSQVAAWINRYGKELDQYGVKESEQKHKITLALPSGRDIVLNGYVDGEGDNILMENKCRGEWDEDKIAHEIDLNLQVNIYLLFFKAKYGHLPERVWYQHLRRPGGFGYRGPRQKDKESRDAYKGRLVEAINNGTDYHFWRYWMLPDQNRINRFLHACLYPMLEHFLDWYEYVARGIGCNRYHWMTPYGLYNPFTEGTLERYRTYRMTGSTIGLRTKVPHR